MPVCSCEREQQQKQQQVRACSYHNHRHSQCNAVQHSTNSQHSHLLMPSTDDGSTGDMLSVAAAIALRTELPRRAVSGGASNVAAGPGLVGDGDSAGSVVSRDSMTPGADRRRAEGSDGSIDDGGEPAFDRAVSLPTLDSKS